MSDIDEALAEIEHLNDLVENDGFDKSSVAFVIAKHIVNLKDKTLLKSVSKEYQDLVRDMVAAYEEDGEYKVYSGVGCADHSEMVASLACLLKQE